MRQRRIILASALLAASVGVMAQAPTAPVSAPSGPPAVTSLSMMASVLPSADLDRSIAFYTNGLGMTLRARIEMPSGTEAPLQFPGGGPNIMLFKPKAEGAHAVANSLHRVILAVPDLKALEAKLIAAGYHLNAPISEQAKYHVAVAQLDDPDGNHLELVQRLP